jgi:predicted cation transporter
VNLFSVSWICDLLYLFLVIQDLSSPLQDLTAVDFCYLILSLVTAVGLLQHFFTSHKVSCPISILVTVHLSFGFLLTHNLWCYKNSISLIFFYIFITLLDLLSVTFYLSKKWFMTLSTVHFQSS